MNWKKLTGPFIPEKKGDEISGKLIKVEEEVGTNLSMFYTLETEDSISGVWGSTVLDEKMKLFEVGNYVKIVFLGLKEGNRKEGYKDFEVHIGRE
ncbi:hypothetical protein LCGC14_0737900 [marine sediment metagenome]|uniref:Uncharacterized protein n=1 Tax=marine sediment metagenome TaxID=412755 RepID=A0A0F9QBU1_9ZZZZ